jgi:hypothetical protein
MKFVKNNDVRAERNGRLRARLKNMKGDVNKQMNELFSNMMGIDPASVLFEEEINAHLTEAFNKFDESGDGILGQWEFQQAWFFLGLKGSEAEIQDAFKDVDTNNSGLIDVNEFCKSIKGERMMEISLTRVLNKIGVQYSDAQSQYEAFKKTAARRRLMKK